MNKIKIIVYPLLVGIVIFGYRYALVGYQDGKIDIEGKAPKGYDIRVVTLYSSDDERCKESDWNTGSWKHGITSNSSLVRVEDGHYKTSFYKHIKKRFCDWDIIYTQIDLLSPRYSDKSHIEVKKPIYSVILKPTDKYNNNKVVKIKNKQISEHFLCALEDRLKDDKQYIKRSMFCVNKDKGYDNNINFEKSFNALTSVEIDFDLKDEIYCFVGRRSCPTYAKIGYVENIKDQFKIEAGISKPKPIKKYTYNTDTNNMRSLYHAIELDSANYNIPKAKEILSKHPELVTSDGYRLFQTSLAWSFSYGRVDFETIKMLTSYGYDISKHKQKYFVKDEVEKYLESLDMNEAYFCMGYEYDTLPESIKKELKSKGITPQNGYYIKKPRKNSLLSDIGSSYREKSVEIISWMLSHGYKASESELTYALYNTLYHDDLENPTQIIKSYIKLGANLHDPDVGFALMSTMRLRFDDIKTLKTLIDAGVDINAQDKEYGSTVLFALNYKLGSKYRQVCSYRKYKDIIKEYIKLGADINHKMKDGTTLYQNLQFECDKKALMQLGADTTQKKKEEISIETTYRPFTPL